MKIKDPLTTGSKVLTTGGSHLLILDNEGKTLFEISIKKNELIVNGGDHCLIDEKQYGSFILVRPMTANQLAIMKRPYGEGFGER